MPGRTRLLHPEKQAGMTTLLNIADWIFIFVLGLPVLYLFVFALFSTRKSMDDYPQAKRRRKFVTLIPAYKSDAVIVRTAQAALRQEYVADVKASLRAQLNNTSIKEPDGTVHKLGKKN